MAEGSRIPHDAQFRDEFLLKPYPEKLMDAHDVSRIVNSAKYDGRECVQPVSDDDVPAPGQLSLLAGFVPLSILASILASIYSWRSLDRLCTGGK